jgi:hypothetical protein
MNRRTFTRLSAFALAAARIPSFAQTSAGADKPVGFAAIGLGTISDIFMRACAESKTAKITALVTGHPQTKGKHYAALYGIPESSIYTYETFDRIRDNQNIDAVTSACPTACTANTPSAPRNSASTCSARSPWPSHRPSAAR